MHAYIFYGCVHSYRIVCWSAFKSQPAISCLLYKYIFYYIYLFTQAVFLCFHFRWSTRTTRWQVAHLPQTPGFLAQELTFCARCLFCYLTAINETSSEKAIFFRDKGFYFGFYTSNLHANPFFCRSSRNVNKQRQFYFVTLISRLCCRDSLFFMGLLCTLSVVKFGLCPRSNSFF